MHTETNRAGKHAVEWLWKEWMNLLRLREDGVPIIGFTWFGLVDMKDWDTALTKMNGAHVNKVGLYTLDRNERKVAREYRRLVEEYSHLPDQQLQVSDPDGVISSEFVIVFEWVVADDRHTIPTMRNLRFFFLILFLPSLILAQTTRPVAPIIALSGDGAAMGKTQGEKLAAAIHALDEGFLRKAIGPSARPQALQEAALFREKIDPSYAAEIDALADAARIDRGEIMLANCFLDLMPNVACSTITLPAEAAPDHVARFGAIWISQHWASRINTPSSSSIDRRANTPSSRSVGRA